MCSICKYCMDMQNLSMKIYYTFTTTSFIILGCIIFNKIGYLYFVKVNGI
jgi:hypothetical protein